MQLNGTIAPTMAASEPPEPPPRNPDKINASLGKHITVDAVGRNVNSSNRSFPHNNTDSSKAENKINGCSGQACEQQ